MDKRQIDAALERLREAICAVPSAVLAFSGGVDSALVAAVAQQELGDNLLGVTADCVLHPPFQIEDAKKLAEEIGMRHMVIDVNPLRLEHVHMNERDRCYHCKRGLFEELWKIAEREGIEAVMDGANVDDASGGHRPGLRAAHEMNAMSPLITAGIGKQMVREISRQMGLSTWDKPSFSCYATRVPYGLTLTRERLQMVRDAEEFLRGMGLRQYRVRHHDSIARIEVPQEELTRMAEPGVREKIVAAFEAVGYTYVTLDLAGFRSGSMDEVPPEPEEATAQKS